MTKVPAPRSYRGPICTTPNANMIRVTLCVSGVKSRCRKTDFHVFDIKDYSFSEFSNGCKAEAQALAYEIFQKNIKEAKEAYLSFQPVEHRDGILSLVIFSETRESLQDPSAFSVSSNDRLQEKAGYSVYC